MYLTDPTEKAAACQKETVYKWEKLEYHMKMP